MDSRITTLPSLTLVLPCNQDSAKRDEMETLPEEVFTTRTGYIRTRIYNSFVVEEECTAIAVAGLSNPLLSESFGDTLTIATTKGMEAATEERLFGLVQQFFQGLISDTTR